MRSTNRVLIMGGVCLAIVLALAWRAPAQQDAKGGLIGVVDVIQLLEEMLDSGDYGEASKTMRAEIETQLTEMQEQLTDLQTELQTMDPNSPEFAQKAQRYQAIQMNLQQTAQQRSAEFDAMRAHQAIEAYKRLVETVGVVAGREGYRYVMPSRIPADDIGDAQGLGAVTQQILARPIIAGVEKDDLTARVRAELGLPEPTDDAAAPADATPDAGEDAGG